MSVTTVLGTGTADAAPERVEVGITIRGEADTTAKAKTIAKAKLAELYEVIRKLDASGVPIGEQGLSTRFSVRQHQQSTHTKLFYEARFDGTVTSRATDAGAKIFDALATIEAAAVESPTFAISDAARQRLRNDAFREAVADAKARFRFQCEVIGFDPSAFEIVSWEYNGPRYGNTSGKLLRVEHDHVTVTGSNVEVKCELRLTYDRKGAQP